MVLGPESEPGAGPRESGLGGGGLGLQGGLGLFDQARKRRGVGNRDLGELATVELDVGGLEAFDEAAVADAGLAAGGVQTHDPKATHVGLLLLAIDVGVLPGMLDSFFRVAEELGLAAEIAFGVFQHFLVAFAGRRGVGCTSHVLYRCLEPAGRLVRIHPPS
jgi:hypothetical protein